MKKNPGTVADRQRGVMFGLAYGDALGRPTEFMKASTLAKFGSPFRLGVGLNKPQQGIVTDDTQMAIAVAKAALGSAHPSVITSEFIFEFIRWYEDPKSLDGKRAPGATCMGAVGDLTRNPKQWLLATRPHSKGNGANMRVAPLALRTDWTWDELGGAAQLQAAITHGHPTALAAAELTAAAVRMLLTGFTTPGEWLVEHLLAYAYAQRDRYRGDYLGSLWEGWLGRLPPSGLYIKSQDVRIQSPKEFIRHGWDEMIDSLLNIYGMPRDPNQDPCKIGGGGWVAEEALTCSIHTLLCFPDNPTDALRRAAFTDGDSDSIGAITGALAGAAYGRSAFPKNWIQNLEYRGELESLTAKLANAAR